MKLSIIIENVLFFIFLVSIFLPFAFSEWSFKHLGEFWMTIIVITSLTGLCAIAGAVAERSERNG